MFYKKQDKIYAQAEQINELDADNTRLRQARNHLQDKAVKLEQALNKSNRELDELRNKARECHKKRRENSQHYIRSNVHFNTTLVKQRDDAWIRVHELERQHDEQGKELHVAEQVAHANAVNYRAYLAQTEHVQKLKAQVERQLAELKRKDDCITRLLTSTAKYKSLARQLWGIV